jgi:hypothetical protein
VLSRSTTGHTGDILRIIAARNRTFCFPAGFLFDTGQESDVYRVAFFFDLFPASYPLFMGGFSGVVPTGRNSMPSPAAHIFRKKEIAA